jgi:hypothetical protein
MGDYLFAKNFVAKQNIVSKIINSTLTKVKNSKDKLTLQEKVKRMRINKERGRLIGLQLLQVYFKYIHSYRIEEVPILHNQKVLTQER